ncbi:hypothetical protein [Domibacillus tundrae]|uniref:hypothetical protein n=1 Tax=Domibacillus tundrae TaxID=1587527 RepID=UPI003CCBCC1A
MIFLSSFIISFLVYMEACIFAGIFMYLFRKKKLIGFQLGMNISQVMGGMAALLTGVLLIQQFPFHFTLITIISAGTGLAVGGVFGLLFDYQTFITGLTNGMIVGLMAPMIGSVVEVPVLFLWFIHGLFFVSFLAIYFSIQRS